MELSRIQPQDTEAIDQVIDLWERSNDHDEPGHAPTSPFMLKADVNNVDPEIHHEFHVAKLGGQVAGFVTASMPLRDNTHQLIVVATVDPRYRRRGIGTALLERAMRVGKDNGRTTVASGASEQLPDGPKRVEAGREFLLRHGFEVAHASRRRIVDLASIDGPLEQELLDESWPHAGGYELVQWSGPTPAEHLGGAAALASRLSTDVPFGDLNLNEVVYDAERYRAKEVVELARGLDFTCTYVRHIDSGELVAHSVIGVVDDAPQYAGPWITLVHPDHRGHRLGMIVKIENHRLLRRAKPAVRWIKTSNAEANSHMVSINQRLGFAEVDRKLDFQRDL